uniref:Uncharacterized protein n=1 Tax=Tanacetum cinerariifolium TaxID=118510 RepID=A0A6L2MIB8_TANCI|nr:hypothetical protein [Tanacetum cinerariifolium]
MATTIEQQVALDEVIVPSTQRLRIGRRNFKLPSDIQSKESTLQVVYDVLRSCPFFKAFLVTADVPGIYMQEFWATAYVYQHSIRFKLDNKKHIVNMETFREMLHICPRIPGQSFNELPFEEEILEFLRFLGYSAQIKTLTDEDFMYQVKHKNQKKSNEMYYPIFTKVIIHHFMSKDLSIPRRKKVNWHYVKDDILFSTIKVVSRHQNTQQYGVVLPIKLTNEEIRNTKAYKEYYACATREAAPKPKASARRKRSGSDTSITPPTAITTLTTTDAVTPRLTAATKGKQPAKAKSPSDPSELARTEAQQLKIVLRRSRQETHISQHGGSGINEGTGSSDDGEEDDDDDDEEEIAKTDEQDDAERGGDDDEETKSDEESDGDETREEESFDPIPRTPKDSEDDGNGDEDQGLRINIEDSDVTLTLVNPDGQQDSSSVSSQFVTSMLNPTSDVGMESIFATASSPVAPLQTSIPIMAQSTIATITTISHAPIPPTPIPTVLSEMELKKTLIEKMEGNKSIQRSDEQRNLYKALVEAYEADKIILDTYRERVILKRRRDDDDDQGEGPFTGSDRGSEGQREGKEPESASALLEPATSSAGRSTTGSKSRQASASESAFVEEPVQATSQIEEPSHPVFETDRDWNKTLPAAQGSTQIWISELAKQADSRSSFNELLDTPLDFFNFIMNRLRVDTLTPKHLAGPIYELMKGSCQQYPHNLLQPLPLIPDNRDKDKHALWGVSHWGRKRQQFYGFAVNRESALDVYSKRRIIAVTDLKIDVYKEYRHPVTCGRSSTGSQKLPEEAQPYQARHVPIRSEAMKSVNCLFKPKRIHLSKQGQEKQKRLNLTKPDTYRSDLKRCEAYTAYSNPRGFIYQNKDKKNRLMRIYELYKFSDGTLNDIRNALDDHLKGIRMQYLPTTIWRKRDKDRAATMIQAVDKMLKTRRIMRSLERSILTDLQGTLKGKWRYLIPAKPLIHNHVLIPNYQDFKIQDFRYSNGFKCFQAIKIGRTLWFEGGLRPLSVHRLASKGGQLGFLKSFQLLPGKSRAVCVPQITVGFVSSLSRLRPDAITRWITSASRYAYDAVFTRYVAMLDELCLGDGRLLFGHFKIPCVCFNDGLVLLMADEDVMKLLECVPMFREVDAYVEEDVSVVEQHMIEVRKTCGEFTKKMSTPLGECTNGVNVCFGDSDDDEFPYMSTKRMKEEMKRRISNQFALRDLLAETDLEFGNKSTKMKEKLSQENPSLDEIFDGFNSSLDNVITTLSQDDMDMPRGMVAPDMDDDASISGLEADEVELELEDAVADVDLFVDLDQTYEEDFHSHLDEANVVELELEDEMVVVKIFAHLHEACEEDVDLHLDEALVLEKQFPIGRPKKRKRIQHDETDSGYAPTGYPIKRVKLDKDER